MKDKRREERDSGSEGIGGQKKKERKIEGE